MREKSLRSNLRKRLLILRKKLERTASFPRKLFLGISPRRLILPPNSLRAAPAGAASKPLLPPTKNHEVQFGGVCWKKSELILNKIPTDCRPAGGRTKTECSGGQKGRGLGGRNFCPPSLSPPLFSPPQFFVFRFAKCAAKECCPCPSLPYAGNNKELPFWFTLLLNFDIIYIVVDNYLHYTILIN